MATQNRFTVYDYMVFFVTFGLSLLIGIYFGWKNRKHDSVANYFLANRKLSVLPTSLSLAVTFQSSLMIIGKPAEVYAYGMKYAVRLIGSCSSFIVAGLFVVPVLHPLKLTSANKYFKLRYNDNAVRYLAMTFGIVYYVIYTGVVVFGTCVALDFLMGIPHWATICIYSIVTAIYTSIGGMKAVVWTDVLQLLIMVIGVCAVIIKSCVEVGGVSKVFKIGSSRFNFNDFRFDPTIRYQFWNLAFGNFMGTLVNCFQQPGIQRINSTPSVTTARRLYIVSGIMFPIMALLASFEGVAIFSYYNYLGCDPIASERIDNTNKLIPFAVADLFSEIPGLSGLFIAALSSAALSTISSSLSSLGAVTYDDIIKERYQDISEVKATRISKIIVFLYGIIAMGFTFMIASLPGTIMNIFYALLGCVDGPTCALFILSMFYRRTTTTGLLVGAFVGFGFILWMNIGSLVDRVITTPKLPFGSTSCCYTNISGAFNNSPACTVDEFTYVNSSTVINWENENQEQETFTPLQYMYSISFMIYSLIGCFVSILVAVPVSWCTRPPKTFDERCIFNFRTHVINDLCSKKKREHDCSANDNCEQLVEMQNPLINPMS